MKGQFFYNKDDEFCYNYEAIIDMMKFNNETEKEIYKATMVTGENVFYCSKQMFIGETYQGYCGKACEDYKPRNGKNGRCRFSKNCYEPGELIKIKI